MWVSWFTTASEFGALVASNFGLSVRVFYAGCPLWPGRHFLHGEGWISFLTRVMHTLPIVRGARAGNVHHGEVAPIVESFTNKPLLFSRLTCAFGSEGTSPFGDFSATRAFMASEYAQLLPYKVADTGDATPFESLW